MISLIVTFTLIIGFSYLQNQGHFTKRDHTWITKAAFEEKK